MTRSNCTEYRRSTALGPTEVHALSAVDLSVERGELVAIMGPSGSGKSTLLTIAGSLEEPTQRPGARGRGRSGDASRASDRARMRRRSIGYVFQDFNLLPGLTAVENVSLPLELDGVRSRAARATGLKALEELDVAERADRYPDELSGGERQRVAIARAIVGERGLLLADEPTGALDSVNGEGVMRLLRAATHAGRRGCRGHPRGAPCFLGRPRRLPARRARRRPDGRAARPGVAARGGRAAMTTVAHEARPRGSSRGGVAARRAIVRWAWRMFRREWRQQILVTALLVVAVAAAIGSVTVAYNSGPADNAEFGSASNLLRFEGSDPAALDASLDAARDRFGTIEVIGHRTFVVPGGVETVEFRAQDPQGVFGSALLALRRGSYPVGPRQVAVTDKAADLLGSSSGRARPGRTQPDRGRHRREPARPERRVRARLPLVRRRARQRHGSGRRRLDTRFLRLFSSPTSRRRGRSAPRSPGPQERPESRQRALAMFSVATVFLLLASLVAAAGFAVVAQRRLRQLGMLAAVGATQKHLRLVLLTNGVIVGAIGALLGAIVGLGLWLALLPTLETAFDHRLDPFGLPWALLALVGVVAVLGATGAAWWPGRAVARVPVTLALSGRPPRPRPARHSAIAGAALIAVGVGCLALSNRDRAPLIVAGILATVLGTLLLGPLAIRIFAGTAGHTPIAARLALRDLARHQARSGAALAAITLALGIAAAVVVTGAAEEKEEDDRLAAGLPNLSDRQIRVYTGPTNDPELIPLPLPTSARLARSAARVRQIAADLEQATVVPLWKALQSGDPPIVTFEGNRALVAVDLARQVDERRWTRESGVYVATPALLRYLGVDPATVSPSSDFLADRTVPTARLDILSFRVRDTLAVTNVQRIDSRQVLGSAVDGNDLLPSSFVTLDGLRRHGWTQIPSGWLVESSRPLTSDQIAAARELAAEAGLAIETKHESESLATPIAVATAAGAFLALAILAMTVGLIRGESAGDLRTLTATGATGRIRRTLTATTAGALALLGALLGVAGAYAVLLATYHDDLGYLGRIPLLPLAVIVAGVPLTAAAAGWLLAGRQPAAIARPVID